MTNSATTTPPHANFEARVFLIAGNVGPGNKMVTNVIAVQEAVARMLKQPPDSRMHRWGSEVRDSATPSALALAGVTQAAITIRPEVVRSLKQADLDAKGL